MRPIFCRGIFAAVFLCSFLSAVAADFVNTNRVRGDFKWAFKTRGAVTASPALSDDSTTLYVGSMDRNFYAIDVETGELVWSVRMPGTITESATVHEDRIYVPCNNGRLYALSEEGEILWSFRTKRRFVSSPAVDDQGNVYFGSHDNRLYALEPEEGLQLGGDWPFRPLANVGTPMIATGDGDNEGYIYVVAGGKLYGVSADAEEVSKFSAGERIRSIPAVGEDGSIYVGANDNRFYSIESGGTTNDVQWRYYAGKNVASSPVIGADGSIYVGSDRGWLYRFNTNGQVRAGWPMKARGPIHSALAIGADGTVYAGSDDTRMYAVAPDGKVRWTFKTRGRIRSAPAIDNQGIIYFGSNDRYVYAVYDDEILTEENVWPMFRRDRLHTARATGGDATIIQQPEGIAVDNQFIADHVRNGVTTNIVEDGSTSLNVLAGTNVLVSVVARGASTPTYQWRLNGVPINTTTNPSAARATLVLTNVQFAASGDYTVEISNQNGEVVSEAFKLTVQSAPTFNITATNLSFLAGNTLTLNANASGTFPLFYQWFTNGVAFDGQTNANLIITNVQPGNSGDYTVEVRNSVGTTRSVVIRVTVYPNSLVLSHQQLGAGQRHSLAVLDDSSLWAWGLGNSGQLGDARNSSGVSTQWFVATPVLIGTNGAGSTNSVWTSVSAGGRGYDAITNLPNGFSLGLQTNGTLWAWGVNDRGQLGVGSSPSFSTVPVRVGSDSNWMQVEAGAMHAIALKSDGTIWTWGANQFGQLGQGNTNGSTTPVRVGADSAWVEVRAGAFFTLARHASGAIYGWGANEQGQLGLGATAARILLPTQVGSGTNWSALSAGVSHSLGLRDDGSLWSWGLGNSGQLGTGGNTNSLAPTRVGDAVWDFIEAGSFHSFAILSNGNLFAWGANWFGQLGDGFSGGVLQTNSADRFAPSQIAPTVTWRAVDASTHSLGIDTSGNVYAWGFNSHGQVGDGSTNNVNAPVLLVFTNGTSTSLTNAPPTLTAGPTNLLVFQGSNATFSVAAAGGAPLSYQWYFNASNVISTAANATATNASLVIASAQPADAGFYRAVVTNRFGAITSVLASLTITNTNGIIYLPNGTSVTNGSPPVITVQPQNHFVFAGANTSFSVTATGSPTLTYQWYFDGNAIPWSSNLTATQSVLVITNVATNQFGVYFVDVANHLGTVRSTNVFLASLTTNAEAASLPGSKAAVGPRLALDAVTSTGVVLRVSGALPGRHYVFEAKGSLPDDKWTPLEKRSGPFERLVDPAVPPVANRFYRLREE